MLSKRRTFGLADAGTPQLGNLPATECAQLIGDATPCNLSSEAFSIHLPWWFPLTFCVVVGGYMITWVIWLHEKENDGAWRLINIDEWPKNWLLKCMQTPAIRLHPQLTPWQIPNICINWFTCLLQYPLTSSWLYETSSRAVFHFDDPYGFPIVAMSTAFSTISIY